LPPLTVLLNWSWIITSYVLILSFSASSSLYFYYKSLFFLSKSDNWTHLLFKRFIYAFKGSIYSSIIMIECSYFLGERFMKDYLNSAIAFVASINCRWNSVLYCYFFNNMLLLFFIISLKMIYLSLKVSS
jgi:hypothetical protein